MDATNQPSPPSLLRQPSPLSISVIIPAHNAAEHLPHCLAALATTDYPVWECLVVDDHSADTTPSLAVAYLAHVIALPPDQHGPAAARNLGAHHARGQVLLFLDADVCVRPDTLARVARCLLDNPDHAACFGAYDDAPTAPNFLSQFKNLQHHYVHQHSAVEATTFWAGCGAIYRQVYQQLGGFSTAYTRSSIEDIELGYRLRAVGYRIRLDKSLQVTHRKAWTWRTWLVTDVRDRAIPWARLIIGRGRREDTLNLQPAQRLSVVAAWLTMLGLGATAFHPWGAALALGALSALVSLNRTFYAFLAGQRGRLFMLGALLCHLTYFLYSGLAYACVWLAASVQARRPLTPAGVGEQSP